MRLIVDGNWLLMSRMYSFREKFSLGEPEAARRECRRQLKESMVEAIGFTCSRFERIDRICVVRDRGSWRKVLTVPEGLAPYKGNRKRDEETDWANIFGALEDLCDEAAKAGWAVLSYPGAEGDDCVMRARDLCMEAGEDCMIWSTDRDLQQLVKNKGGNVCLWWNETAGLFREAEKGGDLRFLIDPEASARQGAVECLGLEANEIRPGEIVCMKTLSGDKSDNILSPVSYMSGERRYGLTEKMARSVLEDLGIGEPDEIEERLAEVTDRVIAAHKKFAHESPEGVADRIAYNLTLTHIERVPEEIRGGLESLTFPEEERPASELRDNCMALIGGEPIESNIINEIAWGDLGLF
jgi:5'-3' exonuclease